MTCSLPRQISSPLMFSEVWWPTTAIAVLPFFVDFSLENTFTLKK